MALPRDDSGHPAWYPCAAVIEEPRDITVPGGATVALDAAVTGSGVITLSWTHDGNPVVDDAHVSGSATSNLHIEPAGAADAGVYQLTASDSCGNVTSRLATVTVHCPADFDGDGTVDFFDYDAFVSCFEGQACPPGKTADFDSDGSSDFFDYDAFVVAFETPC